MKTKLKLIAICHLLIAICLSTHAQGTAFTYQGRLNSGGSPASGNYDFRFRLDADPLGNTILATASTNAVPVTNGLFITTIDFGAGWFNGSNYWLEVDVRTNATGSYVGLTPLQPLLPTPYAIMANSASNLLGALPAAQLSGTLQNSSLPASPTFSGAVTANSFSGNGASVTGVNAASLNGLGAANFWQTGGNAGTTPGVNFLGTTDNQPLEFHVNGQRGLLLEYASESGGPIVSINVIAGSSYNFVAPGVMGATVAGGGGTNTAPSPFGGSIANSATAHFATVGGGMLNTASSYAATIAGGSVNTSANQGSTVGGGFNNNASGEYATIAGGYGNGASGAGAFIGGGGVNDLYTLPNHASGTASVITGGAANAASGYGAFVGGGGIDGATTYSGNTASGNAAVVAGGIGNQATTNYATVPGGANNVAGGQSSFAAGQQAQALNNGTFVWADGSSSSPFASTATNQFLIRASGGVGIGTTTPTENLTIAGVNNYNNGLKLTGSTANGTGMAIENTASGGHKFDLISGGASSAEGAGAFELYDETVGGFRLTISTNGNVGIGTGGPNSALAVVGNIYFGKQRPNTTFNQVGDTIYLGAEQKYLGNTLGTPVDGTTDWINLMANSLSAGIIFGLSTSTANPHSNNIPLMVIKSNGNVGIGATNPAHLFVVGSSVSPAYCDGTTWVNGSDRNSKQDFAAINPAEVLQKVAAMPMTKWQYKIAPGQEHIGPMAQDFHQAFGLNGSDDKHISTVDEGGVALAAIQGLNQKLQAELNRQDAEATKLKQQNDSLAERLNELETAVKLLAEKK